VEPLYSGHPWDSSVSRLKEVSSFQGYFCTLFYVAGTMGGVLIKGDLLISQGILIEGFHCNRLFQSPRFILLDLLSLSSTPCRMYSR
jgi:hypothetical protein